MPWNSSGEWVNPEGWEDYDVEDLFSQIGTQEGMQDVIGELTGAEGDDLSQIIDVLSPYDMSEQRKIKTAAENERMSLREGIFAQSVDTTKMIAKSGFASTYSGASKMNNLWSEYLNKMKEISKAKSYSLYKSKADYLDRIWSEAMVAEEQLFGGDD